MKTKDDGQKKFSKELATETERILADYLYNSNFNDLPREPIDVIKKVITTIIGTTIAGATSEGCEAIVDQVKQWGGRKEATILMYGGKVPACNAALANSVMARALDICDYINPGIHIGSSAFPCGLAAAELVGGCSGKDFLTALVLGTELAARISSISKYDGIDHTGVCTVFGTAAIVGKILRLNSKQMLDALALAFNRAGGSLQSNVDGSLAVRFIQGFTSQNGIVCAQLAQRGISGPKNFIDGVYGYYHLFANDNHNDEALIGELGKKWQLLKLGFKSYPSCGATIASTDAILSLVRDNRLAPDNVAHIDVTVTPVVHDVVGHPFEMGDNPTVNAQFNIRYVVANAILRKSSKLHHFDSASVMDPQIVELAKKVNVQADPYLNEGKQELLTKVLMKVTTKRGDIYTKTVDIPSGSFLNPLTAEAHRERFEDNVSYGGKPLPRRNIDKLVSMVNQLEEIEDVRSLIPLFVSRKS